MTSSNIFLNFVGPLCALWWKVIITLSTVRCLGRSPAKLRGPNLRQHLQFTAHGRFSIKYSNNRAADFRIGSDEMFDCFRITILSCVLRWKMIVTFRLRGAWARCLGRPTAKARGPSRPSRQRRYACQPLPANSFHTTDSGQNVQNNRAVRLKSGTANIRLLSNCDSVVFPFACAEGALSLL